MGSCFSCCYRSNATIETTNDYFSTAIKSPGGTKYIFYSPQSNTMIGGESIDEWIQNLYQYKIWQNYIVYNDQTEKMGIHGSTHGHTKGILCWDESKISWLVHSVPNFPRTFEPHGSGTTISKLEHAEHIYGQSFVYVEIDRSPKDHNFLDKVLKQLFLMDPHIYISSVDYNDIKRRLINHYLKKKVLPAFSRLPLTDQIHHIAKPHSFEKDIYQDYLVEVYGGPCRVESWMRGQPMHESDTVKHVKCMKTYHDEVYTETHDHSKIAVSSQLLPMPWTFIGDLNRMESQKTRGGGGIILLDKALSKSYDSLIIG